jgi:hypothetical protein
MSDHTTVYLRNVRITRRLNRYSPGKADYHITGAIQDVLAAGLCRDDWLPVAPKRVSYEFFDDEELTSYSVKQGRGQLMVYVGGAAGKFRQHFDGKMAIGIPEAKYVPPDAFPPLQVRRAALNSALGRHDTLGYGRFLAKVFNGRNLPDWRPGATT